MSTANDNARRYATRARTAAAAATKAATDTEAAAPGCSKKTTQQTHASSNSSVSKRALGDITNSQRHTSNHVSSSQQPPPSKVRRTEANTKPVPSAASRHFRAHRDAKLLPSKNPYGSALQQEPAHQQPDCCAAAPSPLIDTTSSSSFRSESQTSPAVALQSPTAGRHRTSLVPCGVIDIDAADVRDPLAVSKYAKDIYRNLRSREARFMVPPLYMDAQPEVTVKMRSILVDWLVDVHQKFRLSPETLHLTVNVIDRFLAVTPVRRRKLQLVGVTAMLIASKYEELFAPETADFVYITDRAYRRDEILHMEAVILNVLHFDVTVPSAISFLRRCFKAARAHPVLSELEYFSIDSGRSLRTSPAYADASDHPSILTDASFLSQNADCFALYVLELSMQDSSMLDYCPSVRAATACLLGIKCFSNSSWSPTLQYYSGDLDEQDLRDCEGAMRRLVEAEQLGQTTNKLTAIKRKFAHAKFNSISVRAMGLDLSSIKFGTPDIVRAHGASDFAYMDICNEERTIE
jgi:Cyclin, N-terminal domain/Cyclin, C-terminal domain